MRLNFNDQDLGQDRCDGPLVIHSVIEDWRWVDLGYDAYTLHVATAQDDVPVGFVADCAKCDYVAIGPGSHDDTHRDTVTIRGISTPVPTN